MTRKRKRQITDGAYDRIRAGLLMAGFSLRSWSHSRGYKQSTVYDAAKGARSGVQSVKIRKELEIYANS